MPVKDKDFFTPEFVRANCLRFREQLKVGEYYYLIHLDNIHLDNRFATDDPYNPYPEAFLGSPFHVSVIKITAVNLPGHGGEDQVFAYEVPSIIFNGQMFNDTAYYSDKSFYGWDQYPNEVNYIVPFSAIKKD